MLRDATDVVEEGGVLVPVGGTYARRWGGASPPITIPAGAEGAAGAVFATVTPGIFPEDEEEGDDDDDDDDDVVGLEDEEDEEEVDETIYGLVEDEVDVFADADVV